MVLKYVWIVYMFIVKKAISPPFLRFCFPCHACFSPEKSEIVFLPQNAVLSAFGRKDKLHSF